MDIIDDLSIPDKKVYHKNRSIDPRFQNELYLAIKKQVARTLPPFPGQNDFYSSLEQVFRLIAKYLLRDSSMRYKYCTFIADRWINETPYKQILDRQVSLKLRGRIGTDARKREVNEVIEQLNDTLEEMIRYDYTRGMKCYSDIVSQILTEEKSQLRYCRDLHLYLESGASSSRVRFLIGAGLPRATAIEIVEGLGRAEVPEWTTISGAIQWLRENLDVLKGLLHPILYEEIRQLVI